MILLSRRAAMIAASLIAPFASAATINVPADQPTIQAAIDASANGDEIVIAPGTYLESINTGARAITIRSADPANPATVGATIIDGDGSGTVVTLGVSPAPNVTLDGLTIRNGNLGISAAGTTPRIIRCVIRDHLVQGGLRISNAGFGTLIDSCSFINNTTETRGGGIMAQSVSRVLVIDSLFEGNTAGIVGGAIDGASTTFNVVRSRFLENECNVEAGGTNDVGGGAVYLFSNGVAGRSTFQQCLFASNISDGFGGAVCDFGADTRFLGTTFADNTASSGGAIFRANAGGPVTNCILWGNSPDGIFLFGPAVQPTYSITQDATLGTGSISTDPLFVDPSNGDYRLGPASPAIDAGNNLEYDGGTQFDLDKMPRFVNLPGVPDTGIGSLAGDPRVDMGAYERQQPATDACPGDADGSGTVNFADLVATLFLFGPCPE